MLSLVLLVILASLSLVSSQTSPPPCPRVRKAWDQYSDAEKATYIQAIEASMDRGLFQSFMGIHQDRMNNREAHGTCMFLLWHRKFLVGFENMLRSLDPVAFGCVTLPYYDYVQHNLDYVNQQCTSIESCSAILRDLGGSSSFERTSSTVGGVPFRGINCVDAAPLDHFCEAPPCQTNGCVPRGRWTSTYFSPDVNFNRVKAAVFDGLSVATVTSAIELSVHNSVHNMLGGAMRNLYVSAADPIFYSHHATIDLLHTIYENCRIKPLGLSESQRRTDPRAFEGCVISGEPVNDNTTVLMEESTGGGQAVDAYFRDVPSKYGDLTDTTRLGNHSYSYDIGGLLGDMFTKCEASGNGLPVEEERRLKAQWASHVVRPVKSSQAKAFLSWRRDVHDQAQLQGVKDSEQEMEKMMVMLYENCLPGDVVDYPSEFKAMWRMEANTPTGRQSMRNTLIVRATSK
ncbi:hypothetical protein Ae201684P_008359 [Aphanomyces euteiches]|uniref:Tyrosinase copper-binding domain-containing protein n=1 Tax=Aphanomyces euteiches TaxID=100861 RepID=A0A6G0XPY3_9STRA|nr:hypothetical protein Ae201684_002491 [Aphanomyces euteiches]KAH9092689.1 hypothetical protein Ae201684P_008359 [Aphanomyces euteiches]